MKFIKISILLVSVFLFSCSNEKEQQTSISSPDGNVKIEFNLIEKGTPSYKVTFKEEEVIKRHEMEKKKNELIAKFRLLKVE